MVNFHTFNFRVLIRTATGENLNFQEVALHSTDLLAHYSEKHFPCYVNVARA